MCRCEKGRNIRTAAFTYDHLHRQQDHRSQCDGGDTQLQSLKKKIIRYHFDQPPIFYTDTNILANPPPVKGKIPWQVGGPRRAMSSDAPRRLGELSQ